MTMKKDRMKKQFFEIQKINDNCSLSFYFCKNTKKWNTLRGCL